MMIQYYRVVLTAGPLHYLLNHLWQSTAFAICAALLVLTLRQASAETRYRIWVTASLKFLIPFSIIADLGARLGQFTMPAATDNGWTVIVSEISQPFTSARVLRVAGVPQLPSLPWLTIVSAIWMCGAFAILLTWGARWLRLRRIANAAEPFGEGREVRILSRLTAEPVPMLSSDSLMEPGVFGILRPVLLVPAGITERLTDEQFEAVLAHEVCHIRRRDNLLAAVHMLIQALFWFHPLVWWLGARLVEERERACDEAVLATLGEPQVYAEGILKVCEFCLESSMLCVSGVTGANLRQRIEDIMKHRIGRQLNPARRLLLSATGVAALAAPIVFGVITAPRGQAQSTGNSAAKKEFEVASIKPTDPSVGHRVQIEVAPGGRFTAKGLNLRMLIQQAYGVRDFQISNAPAWAASDRYDINAKAEGNFERDDLRPMLKALLAERFQLVLHTESKEMPTYALVVGKGGPKLKESEGSGREDRQQMRMGRGMFNGQGVSMSALANHLGQVLGRSVTDKTGLSGFYDVQLEWTPDESQNALVRQAHPDAPPAPPLDSSGPTIYTALQEQLGLKLESQKGPVEILVIDKVEKPTAN